MSFECSHCNKIFSRAFSNKRHEKTCLKRQTRFQCVACGEFYSTKKTLNCHIRSCGQKAPANLTKKARLDAAQGQLYEVESSFGGTLRTFFIPCSGEVD
uniref:C2H2-type domain-containing protein n=2 Tax=Rhodnius prolixus TaxID=13249 RepID=T1HW20_RHOPR